MKKYAMAACLFMAALNVCAQTKEKDSLRVIDLQEVEIISTRATGTTPVAFTNINKDQLKKQNFGQDLPYLLSMTPSAITTSDAGAGIGYTTLRVRGTDGTRINVTANGIPINDAESHNVFWVNLPDFASSVKDMQIQRGAGTSTNGAGAFGASINMQTGRLLPEAVCRVERFVRLVQHTQGDGESGYRAHQRPLVFLMPACPTSVRTDTLTAHR